MARFGAVTVLPDLLMALVNFGGTSHGHAARVSPTWRRSGNNSGRFDAAGPMRARPRAERPSRVSMLNLANNLLLAISTHKAVHTM